MYLAKFFDILIKLGNIFDFSVGCGAGMSLIVIDRANASDRLDQVCCAI